MRFQLRNKQTLEHIRYQNFEDAPPELSEQKQLEWVEAELPAPKDENFYDNIVINEFPWMVSTPKTPEQVIARLESEIDRHLDAVAQSYRYESIRTMVTYATSDHPTFGAEGRAAVKFRDACYAYGIQAIADVQDGERGIPTEVELIAEMPTFESFLGT